MRRRIQHPRKQRPSRVQIERVRAPGQGVNEDGRLFAARVDMRQLIEKRTGHTATFKTRDEAEREALFALACRYLDATGWQTLQAIERDEPHDALAVIDLLELGLVDDDSQVNTAGRQVLERLGKPAIEPPPGPAVPISTGALIHQARAMAEHGRIDLDAPLFVHVKIGGKSHLLNVYETKINCNSLQLEVIK